MSVIRVGAVVTPSSGRASGVLVGEGVAVFEGGVSVAVAWRKDGPVLQHNVGARWLRIP